MKERNAILRVTCCFCNKVHELRVVEEDAFEYMSQNRRCVQDIFPYLSAEERELLISNICPDCWDAMFLIDEEMFEDDDLEEYDEWDEYAPSAEDLKEWQEASCGLC